MEWQWSWKPQSPGTPRQRRDHRLEKSPNPLEVFGLSLSLEKKMKHLAFLILAVAIATQMGHAAELVTLANGFSISCNHHDADGDRVRLYTGNGPENYIEIRPDEISNIQIVPDPPPPARASVAPAVAEHVNLSPEELHQVLAKAGRQHNLDADLLASVVKAESGGNARARSHAGAQGLMQLMPGTASELGVSDSFQPEQNVRGGSTYLDALLTRYHDNLALALAAYNAGPAAVDRYHGIPPYRETRLYVARVIREFNRRIRARELETRQTGALKGQ